MKNLIFILIFGIICVNVAGTSIPAASTATGPYLIPNTRGCWLKCGKKGGSCPTICGKGGYCCRKGYSDCPKYLANLNPAPKHACIFVPPGTSIPAASTATGPYLIPNTRRCWLKCGKKGGSCPTICGKRGYCCRKGYSDCPKYLANLNPAPKHACIFVPPVVPKTCIEKRCKDKMNIAAAGCFNQWLPPMKEMDLLFNDRKSIKWDKEGFKASVCSAVCRCGQAAKDKGYKYFSIRNFGGCYASKDQAGMTEAMGNENKKSKDCIKVDGSYQKCDHSGECVGVGNHDYIYSL